MTEMQQLADERSTEEAAQAPIQMGYPFSVGHITEARVMAAIAAAPVDTDDEVAIAARRALSVQLPEISIPVVDAADVDPACEARRFTLVRVHDFPIAKGRNEDVVIMRGDFAEVLGAVRIGREDRTVLKKNVAYAERRGRRVLGGGGGPRARAAARRRGRGSSVGGGGAAARACGGGGRRGASAGRRARAARGAGGGWGGGGGGGG
ncbi:hypothetical protein, partial [Propionibacterium sp.]|uniref:hypothetical protein n=1 Tax=Propionibacterium sp. TaxID=1977903 RepID=UPI0039EABEB7